MKKFRNTDSAFTLLETILALGVTFPFKVLVGIPLYVELARRAAG
jgi:hypothetical protein